MGNVNRFYKSSLTLCFKLEECSRYGKRYFYSSDFTNTGKEETSFTDKYEIICK
jgi:hypothetical protein